MLQRTSPQRSRNIFRKIKDILKEKRTYIDENDIQTQMYRQYVRSKRGKFVNIRISGKRHARIGLVAAQCEGALLAPHAYSGTVKASVFEDWFENKLLKKLPKEHIIMDNASFHKKEVLQNLAGKYSQEMIFLPPYSPDYNRHAPPLHFPASLLTQTCNRRRTVKSIKLHNNRPPHSPQSCLLQ